MKVIVAGGRDFVPSTVHQAELEATLQQLGCTMVVSGAARGADTFGEQVAQDMGIPVRRFPAEWKVYGKSAGYRRNKVMANYADALVAFPGGKGTEHMINLAMEKNLKVILMS